MEISCATPTTLDSPEHVAIAQELGYKRAWFYDTPQQSPDVWMMLALAAERAERIGAPLLKGVTVSGTHDEVRQRLATLAQQGVTEVVYQPAGPDIRRELETFMEAASTSSLP